MSGKARKSAFSVYTEDFLSEDLKMKIRTILATETEKK